MYNYGIKSVRVILHQIKVRLQENLVLSFTEICAVQFAGKPRFTEICAVQTLTTFLQAMEGEFPAKLLGRYRCRQQKLNLISLQCFSRQHG